MSKRVRWLTAIVVGCVWCLPAATLASPAPTHDAEPWLFLPWDEGVGRILGNEADSEGPKSFAVKPDGGVLILDQVNLRVIDLDAGGELVRNIALPAATFDDVEQVGGRAVLALDRLVGRTLLVMDMLGTPLAEVALEGRGISRAGMVTAMLPRSDGVWLEVGHRHSVKVLDHQLRPCTRQIVLGRPVELGYSLHGAKDGAGGITLRRTLRNDRTDRSGVTLAGQLPIHRIVWLDEDALGAVYTVLHEARFASTTPYRVQQERYLVVLLDPQLQELTRFESPWVLTSYNQRVEVRVGPQGTLWQMGFSDDGVHLLRWEGRAP